MDQGPQIRCTAFEGHRRIASGSLVEVALALKALDAAFRFMSAMGGDLPGFEEAMRALFAGDRERFSAETRAWPDDLRDHSTRLAEDAFRTPNFVDKLARTPR